MGIDWILFALLGLLWLAAGGLPLSALPGRKDRRARRDVSPPAPQKPR